jgi:FemAB-related protein (PEP-CTERM system-associated)
MNALTDKITNSLSASFETMENTETSMATPHQVVVRANSTVEIRLASDPDQEAWDEYVVAHPKGTAYHLWRWREIVSSVHRHSPKFLIAHQDGRLCGLMPLFHNKSFLFGNNLVSTSFCPYGGPISDSAEAEAALIDYGIALKSQLGASAFELKRLHRSEYQPEARFQDINVTFRKTISANDEENLNAIPRKQRAMIRKGIKNELSSELSDVETFYAMFSDNIHRHGTPATPIAFFRAIKASFGDDCEVMAIKSKSGRVVSAVFTIYFRDEVLPIFAGDLPEARDCAANDFKYWEVMRHAVSRGCKVFDFGRSKIGTGAFSFKSNWGFEPTQLYYEYPGLGDSPMPANNILNPKYQLMIKTWKRLPRGLVNWLGPIVVRGLG